MLLVYVNVVLLHLGLTNPLLSPWRLPFAAIPSRGRRPGQQQRACPVLRASPSNMPTPPPCWLFVQSPCFPKHLKRTFPDGPRPPPPLAPPSYPPPPPPQPKRRHIPRRPLPTTSPDSPFLSPPPPQPNEEYPLTAPATPLAPPSHPPPARRRSAACGWATPPTPTPAWASAWPPSWQPPPHCRAVDRRKGGSSSAFGRGRPWKVAGGCLCAVGCGGAQGASRQGWQLPRCEALVERKGVCSPAGRGWQLLQHCEALVEAVWRQEEVAAAASAL